MFVKYIISIWNTSVIIPINKPWNTDGLLFSKIYFLIKAANNPAKTVAIEQASCVVCPIPQNEAKNLSIPPITPAIIPAGAPKISPADKGDASRTLIAAPSVPIPRCVEITASKPKATPIINCFFQYEILVKPVFFSAQ